MGSRIATEVLTWPVSKNGIRRCEGREDGWSTWWHSGSGCAPCASCRSAEVDWSARHALHTPNKAKRPRSTPERRARPSPPPPGTHTRVRLVYKGKGPSALIGEGERQLWHYLLRNRVTACCIGFFNLSLLFLPPSSSSPSVRLSSLCAVAPTSHRHCGLSATTLVAFALAFPQLRPTSPLVEARSNERRQVPKLASSLARRQHRSQRRPTHPCQRRSASGLRMCAFVISCTAPPLT